MNRSKSRLVSPRDRPSVSVSRRRLMLGAVLAGAGLRAAHARDEATRFLQTVRSTSVALVLGGGGCRGYGHIGVIRVLEKHGLKPDLVVGSSAGSLVGGLYAAGMSADQMEYYGRRMSPNLLRDWVFPKLGLFGGDGIRRFVVDRVGPRGSRGAARVARIVRACVRKRENKNSDHCSGHHCVQRARWLWRLTSCTGKRRGHRGSPEQCDNVFANSRAALGAWRSHRR